MVVEDMDRARGPTDNNFSETLPVPHTYSYTVRGEEVRGGVRTRMLVTFAVSKLSSCWLNALAPKNISCTQAHAAHLWSSGPDRVPPQHFQVANAHSNAGMRPWERG